MTTQRDLECEIEELRLEIKENAERIDKLCDILKRNNTKLRTLKGMNYAEKRKEKIINDLQSKNWNIEVMNANYPMLEVIDENTVKIEGVEYKKVSKEKPQTLERIITECMIGYNNTVIVELMERILDRVEVEFLSNKVMLDEEEPLSVMMDYGTGWKNCIKYLKTRLRE